MFLLSCNRNILIFFPFSIFQQNKIEKIEFYFLVFYSREMKLKREMKIERIFFPTIQIEIEFRIGTSKEENDMVLTMGNPGDIWFHARNDSSCHVIEILSKVDISLFAKKEKRKILKKGAEFVKRNTAKLLTEKSVEMIYCDIQHVKKTEYIGCVYMEPKYSKEIRI